MANRNAYQRERYARLKREGVNVTRADYRRALYWQRKANGLCVTCGEPASESCNYCDTHATMRRKLAREYRARLALVRAVLFIRQVAERYRIEAG